MRFRLILLVLMFGLASSVSAQDSATPDAPLQGLVGKYVILRGFDAAPVVHWKWDGQTFLQGPVAVHELGGIKVTSVKLGPHSLELRGQRAVLAVTDKGTVGWINTEMGAVDVDFGSGDQATLLPQIPDTISFRSLDSAKAALPPDYAEVLPASAPGKASKPMVIRCQCECAGETVSKSPDFHPPRVTRQVEPDFTEEARSHKFNGDVLLSFHIGLDGKPSDPWVKIPLGYGLTEKAVQSLAQFRFDPATCKGKPVATTMDISIDFRIF